MEICTKCGKKLQPGDVRTLCGYVVCDKCKKKLNKKKHELAHSR